MTIYERILLTLDQISVRGKSDAERMLGVIATVEQLEKESAEKDDIINGKDKTISMLSNRVEELEAQAKAKEE